jgi:hypothetical protein
MKTSVTSVQLAILETKRERTKLLLAQIDAIHREAAELLELDRDCDGAIDCALADFLEGSAPTTAAELVQALIDLATPRLIPGPRSAVASYEAFCDRCGLWEGGSKVGVTCMNNPCGLQLKATAAAPETTKPAQSCNDVQRASVGTDTKSLNPHNEGL